MNLMNLLSSDGFIIVNRQLAKDIGLNSAVFLYELIKQYLYYTDREETICIDEEEGYFYEKIDDMENWTTLSRKEQDLCIKKLKEFNFIKQIVKGLPAKRYFKINQEKLLDYFSKRQSSLPKRDKLECAKGTNYIAPKGQTSPYIEKRKEKEKRVSIPESIQPASLLHAKVPEIFFNQTESKWDNISQDDINSWKVLYPCVDIQRELLLMIEWCKSNKNKANSKKQWRKFITNWLLSSNEKAVNQEARRSQNNFNYSQSIKKEDWASHNRKQIEKWIQRNPEKLSHIKVEPYYASNKNRRDLEIDFRVINPEDLLGQFKRISGIHEFEQ